MLAQVGSCWFANSLCSRELGNLFSNMYPKYKILGSVKHITYLCKKLQKGYITVNKQIIIMYRSGNNYSCL